MTRLIVMLAIWIAPMLALGRARADAITDVNLSIPTPNGPLVTTGGFYESGPYAGLVFDGSFGAGTFVDDPGFFADAGTLPYSATPPFFGVRFDFVKQLLYWNGSTLAAPSATVTVSRSTRSVTISGTDTAGKPGILIDNIPSDGSYHVHPGYRLSVNAPDGLYGMVMTLGPNGSTTGFTTSEPILVALLKGNFPNYGDGVAAMAAVAFVPEPGAAWLAAAGLALLAARRFRRRNFSCNPLA